MSSKPQQTVPISLPSKGGLKLQRNQPSLTDLANLLNHVANSYDVEYTQICHMLEQVVDNVECIKHHRQAAVTTLRDDIQNLVKAVDTARITATNTNLKKQHEQVQRLEKEKKLLVKQILDGKEEEQELRHRLQSVERQMDSTRRECHEVKGQTSSELPSLEYMKKVLQRLSHVYLTSNGDSSVTQGFVSREGRNDVRPFRFDESTSHFDQVSNLWELISEECR